MIVVLKCKCGNCHKFYSRIKPIVLTKNHIFYRKLREKKVFTMKDVTTFVDVFNEANPDNELVINIE